MDEFMATTAAGGHKSELSRLAANHAVFLDAMGNQLVLAPFLTTLAPTQEHIRILDSATADGLWLRTLRSQLLSPSNSTPPTTTINTHTYNFTGTDINGALFPPNPPTDTTYLAHSFHTPPPPSFHSSFDLVHQRLALGGSPPLAASTVVRGLLRCVRPGGWIQLVEMDLGARAGERGPAMEEFFGLMRAVFGAVGVGGVFETGGLRGVLEEAGEVEEGLRVEGAREERVVVEIGKRGEGKEEVGRKGAEGLAGAVGPLAAVVRGMGFKGLGLDEGRLATLESRMREELGEREGRYEMVVVWGRRALE